MQADAPDPQRQSAQLRFSIIIPTLNEAPVIFACLAKLADLRNESCELILVDGGSVDDTPILAMPFVDKIITTKPGRANQMNKGAQSATGEILIFLHADTFLPEQALMLINQQLGNHQWGRFNIDLQGGHFMFKIIALMMNWRSKLTHIATGDQVIFVTKQAFINVGQFPNISLMEDIALSQALKKVTPPCCLKAKVISSGRRWQKFGVYKTILLMWSLRLRFYLGANPDTLAVLYQRGQFWTASSD